MTIEVRRAADRFRTRAEGRDTFHSFAFGAHYDPANVGFAAMVAHNDEHLPPGTGYDDHRHTDVELVTWVLSGALRHTDSSGRSTVLEPGQVLRTSAGTGIVHAEVSASDEETRFLQTWLRPDVAGVVPSYAATKVGATPGLTQIVGDGGAVDLGVAGARFYVARPASGSVQLPDAGLLHVFLVDGTGVLGDRELSGGDAARLSGEGGRTFVVEAPATLAVWAFT